MSTKKFTQLQLQFIEKWGKSRHWLYFHRHDITNIEISTFNSLKLRGLLQDKGLMYAEWTGIAKKAFGGEGVTIDEQN